MERKTVKTVLASFTAGALLTGSFWLGVDNASYFKESSKASAAQQGTTSNSSIKQASLVDQKDSSVIAQMVQTAGPAVVKIETVSTQKSDTSGRDPFFRQFFGGNFPQQQQTQQALGSGFIINKDGYILTNNHVVEGAQSIKVTVTGQDKQFDAKVIGTDPELDLAVIQITGPKDLPSLKLGNSDNIHVGDWSVAIGNPYGLDHTVTVGVISAKGRPLNIGEARFKDLLQTDASINPGNSGGPLLNLNGEVIGINTAINAEAQGIGFAIPINTVQQVLDDLINKGKVSHPWLGVAIQDMTPELQKYFNTDTKDGAVITYLASGSPAEKAGMQQGDIIVEMDKNKIKDSSQLSTAISNTKIGEKHEFLLIRDGQLKTVTVNIAEKKYTNNN
jgi:serine protease Do